MNRQIIEAIQKMTGTQMKNVVNLFAATVDSVDEAKRTCTVTSISSQGSVTIENVQLMASVDDGLLLIPSIDSTVFVSYSTFNQPFVSLFSGLDKIVLIVGENDASIEMDANGIVMNEGAMGGLVKVIELTQKLNNLENKVNTLITTFNSHVHTGVTTGGGSSAITPTPVTGTLTPTQRGDIENEKIKQG